MVTAANIQETDIIAATAQPRDLAPGSCILFAIQATEEPVRITVAKTKTVNITLSGIKLSASLVAAEKFLVAVSATYSCQ